jgi:hypothetical protein
VTAARRVAAVEAALGPTELVLQFLAEARTFPSLEDYTRSIVGQPISAAPMSRIARGAASSVRSAMKGASRDDVDATVRRAVGDGVFLFVLVIGINGAAMDIARVEGLRAAMTFYWMGCLLGGPHEKDLEPKEWAEHRKDLANCWRQWRAVVAGLASTVMIEDDVREQLEERYLGGQPCLLADAEAAWSTFAHLVDRMWSLAQDLVPLTKAEQRGIGKDGEQLYDERVRERARKLVDDARISAFDKLGENGRAVAILERRLG